MKILLLPLDERPCNRIYPQDITATNDKIHLLIPPQEILSHKKSSANMEEIEKYLVDNCQHVDTCVISIDMLVYGGLLPSRIHHLDKDYLLNRLEILKKIKKYHPQIKIYAFSCIMRCPSYNSSEEEPDYYENYGESIFKYYYLKDKINRKENTKEDIKELESISIPLEIKEDYENRRKKNLSINLACIDLVNEKIIDFLVFPQDDAALYGYTALDQKEVYHSIEKNKLYEQIYVYPGADEVGLSLLTRAYNGFYKQSPKIYPLFSSTLGPTIVPRYEDRPMLESVKSHINVIGAKLTYSIDQADIILAIHAPGEKMIESFDQQIHTNNTFSNILDFVLQIKELVKDHHVTIVDKQTSNGGSLKLIEYLDHFQLIDKINGYAGWNTFCNSLGTSLSMSLLNQSVEPIIYRILEDVFYQSFIRQEIIKEILPQYQISYYDFKDKQEIVETNIMSKLYLCYNELEISNKYPIVSIGVTMPWKRMFEIGMIISFKNRG